MPEPKIRKRGEPAACPFCEQKVGRPRPLDRPYCSCDGGLCDCGAFFLLDATGREGGSAMLAGLLLLTDGDSSRAMAMQSGADYQVVGRGYDPRMHVFERQVRKRVFGRPKLWFFKLERPTVTS